MDANASILDLSALRNAITSLEDALGVVDDGVWFGRQSNKVKNTLMAGVIQNFDFVHAIGVKMLKRRIELDSLNPSEIDELSPAIFRESREKRDSFSTCRLGSTTAR